MQVHEQLVQLGHADDDGLGELLVERLLAGSLRVLWEPLALLDEDEAAGMRSGVGDRLTVVDSDGEPACNVRVTEVFETTWGDPDARLVAGEGYGRDTAAWRRFAGPTLASALAEEDHELTDGCTLLVQTVEVEQVADQP